MNTKTLIVGALGALLGISGCVAGDESLEQDDVLGESEEEILATNPLIFMQSPLSLSAGMATTSIAVQSAGSLGFIAVDGIGLSGLGLTLGTLGVGGLITPLGLTAMPIDAALLGTIRTGLGTMPLMTGLSPLAVSAPLVTTLPISMQTSLASLVGAGTSLAAMQAGLQIALTPSITSSALLFTGLPLITSPTTFIIGASFPFAATSASLASMSVFTSLAVQSAAIRSATFPLPLFPGLGAAGIGMTTPFLL